MYKLKIFWLLSLVLPLVAFDCSGPNQTVLYNRSIPVCKTITEDAPLEIGFNWAMSANSPSIIRLVIGPEFAVSINLLKDNRNLLPPSKDPAITIYSNDTELLAEILLEENGAVLKTRDGKNSSVLFTDKSQLFIEIFKNIAGFLMFN